ncbi:MAG: hypothetical protein ACE10B_07650, partial [Phycisphaerales bacterium]
MQPIIASTQATTSQRHSCDQPWAGWRRGSRRYTQHMLNREACERRVYRLATLLIGDPVTATR